VVEDLETAIRSADVLLTDGPGAHAGLLAPYRITASLLDTAPSGVQFNPCPPFQHGREASADAIDHRAFVAIASRRHSSLCNKPSWRSASLPPEVNLRDL
jgi:ornithine carbamoyltransferase